jgi:hypothetical protein
MAKPPRRGGDDGEPSGRERGVLRRSIGPDAAQRGKL